MSLLEKVQTITPAECLEGESLIPVITAREYLEGEKLSPVKHEYVDGRVQAMAGARRAHNTISGNMYRLLSDELAQTPCRVYIADVKVRVEACYFYPDVAVTCDERDDMDDAAREDGTVDDTMVLYPRLIVEILSESTEAFDRGMKFARYQTLETLEEYVIIHQDQVLVECFQRRADGVWWTHPPVSAGEQVRLTSVDISFAIEVLYDKVKLAPAGGRLKLAGR